MVVKYFVAAGHASSQLGWHHSRIRKSTFSVTAKWVFVGGISRLSVGQAVKLVERENPCKPPKIMVHVVDHDQTGSDVSPGLYKDLSSLPRTLSVSDILSASDNGAKVTISYKGIPGSYDEDAALKAYPNCETVPCHDFEAAFKAVDLWLADKAILPIENTSGGSIYRNYDLLLLHRLHIVVEVQLAVNLSLLALPGVRAEYLNVF